MSLYDIAIRFTYVCPILTLRSISFWRNPFWRKHFGATYSTPSYGLGESIHPHDNQLAFASSQRERWDNILHRNKSHHTEGLKIRRKKNCHWSPYYDFMSLIHLVIGHIIHNTNFFVITNISIYLRIISIKACMYQIFTIFAVLRRSV